MVTTVGTESKVVDLLSDLISLDYAAIEAYTSAIERLENKEFAAKLESFRQDHQRHTQNLAPFVRRLGGNVPREAGAKSFLTTGKVAIAALMGDKAILTAMKTNEDDTNTAYERATKHDDITSEIGKVLDSNLEDEQRHRAWIEETIETL